MKQKHKPDAEMAIIQRGLRDLATLSVPGRHRVLAYLSGRIYTMPDVNDEVFGPQQLDLGDAATGLTLGEVRNPMAIPSFQE
jgi:hypothetical protein